MKRRLGLLEEEFCNTSEIYAENVPLILPPKRLIIIFQSNLAFEKGETPEISRTVK